MKDLLLILAHLLTTLAKLLGPGGAKAIVADSLLMKQQLIVINRSRRRAPNLTVIDRLLLGFWSLFLSSHRIRSAAVILRPSTLLNFHDILKKRKYRLLYSAHRIGTPGPKGPSQALIEAIVELKRRNNRFGCPRIAQENEQPRSKLTGYRCQSARIMPIDGHYGAFDTHHPDPLHTCLS